MRSQVQEGILANHTFGVPINKPSPITKKDLRYAMKRLYDTVFKDPKGAWYPESQGKKPLKTAIARVSKNLKTFPGPICEFKTPILQLQEVWTISGYQQFRLDSDNFVGCNLAK